MTIGGAISELNNLLKAENIPFYYKSMIKKVIKTIEQDAIEQRIGRWIPTGYDGYADGNPVYDWWECSECGGEHTGDEDTLTPYCPNCGSYNGGAG